MNEPRPTNVGEVTGHLQRWSAGDRDAFDALMPLVESELRRLARRHLRRERREHTLQPTALVNEVWLRLREERGMQWHDRVHFYATAARLMRFVLVDYARKRLAGKRGGQVLRVSLSEAFGVADASCEGLVQIHDVLRRLEVLDARKGKVATLRLFSNASVDDIAEVLGVSSVTVARDWRFARAWLHQELQR
jgi:RNA polymerase sigma factor (TIGR02999 family)